MDELGRLVKSSFTKAKTDDRGLTQEDKKILVESLQFRRNYLETGIFNLSGEEARRTGREGCIKLLTDAQIDLLAKMERLFKKLLAP